MPERIPAGTVLELEDGLRVQVNTYIADLGAYGVTYRGPGNVAGARMLEDVWRETSTDKLKQLREEGIYV